jgi:hypothetical protein
LLIKITKHLRSIFGSGSFRLPHPAPSGDAFEICGADATPEISHVALRFPGDHRPARNNELAACPNAARRLAARGVLTRCRNAW